MAWPLTAHAQQSERTRRIGVLMLYPENDPQGQIRAKVFKREFEKLGWNVGGNLQISYQRVAAAGLSCFSICCWRALVRNRWKRGKYLKH